MQQPQEKTKISHFTIIGDSLTDRGEMSHRYLFGILSMAWLSGLKGKSPNNRFTNRFTWADHYINIIIHHIDKKLNQNIKAKTTDEIIHDQKMIDSHYFDDYRHVPYQGHNDFVRCYAEGGMSSHDYSWMPSKSISRFFSRLILTNLGEMRARLLNWDHAQKVSAKQKAQTLVIEWSGANDLVTLNQRPSEIEVKKAVHDRIKNVKKLIKNGYRHFELFNLPDLSLTPRFQSPSVSDNERENASHCATLFNDELAKACQELEETYPHCTINIFDVNTLFNKVYKNPKKYGFDEDKKSKSYCDSQDFKDKVDDPEADKYMFWNDLHPSDKMHGHLAKKLNEKLNQQYDFLSPRTVKSKVTGDLKISSDRLLRSFRKKYTAKFQKDHSGCFGFFRHSSINIEGASLETILKHALYDGGKRTREVLKDLQWIDKNGNLNLKIPALRYALEKVKIEHGERFSETEPLIFTN